MPIVKKVKQVIQLTIIRVWQEGPYTSYPIDNHPNSWLFRFTQISIYCQNFGGLSATFMFNTKLLTVQCCFKHRILHSELNNKHAWKLISLNLFQHNFGWIFCMVSPWSSCLKLKLLESQDKKSSNWID